MQQLTIYHQLIGTPHKMPNGMGIIVDVIFINGLPHVAVHTHFVKVQKTEHCKHKFMISVIYPV
jgi:hypothetical protein